MPPELVSAGQASTLSGGAGVIWIWPGLGVVDLGVGFVVKGDQLKVGRCGWSWDFGK